MQIALGRYLEHYNIKYLHQGWMMDGQTPYSMFKKSLKQIPNLNKVKNISLRSMSGDN
jgi:hypothetical protein